KAGVIDYPLGLSISQLPESIKNAIDNLRSQGVKIYLQPSQIFILSDLEEGKEKELINSTIEAIEGHLSQIGITASLQEVDYLPYENNHWVRYSKGVDVVLVKQGEEIIPLIVDYKPKSLYSEAELFIDKAKELGKEPVIAKLRALDRQADTQSISSLTDSRLSKIKRLNQKVDLEVDWNIAGRDYTFVIGLPQGVLIYTDKEGKRSVVTPGERWIEFVKFSRLKNYQSNYKEPNLQITPWSTSQKEPSSGVGYLIAPPQGFQYKGKVYTGFLLYPDLNSLVVRKMIQVSNESLEDKEKTKILEDIAKAWGYGFEEFKKDFALAWFDIETKGMIIFGEVSAERELIRWQNMEELIKAKIDFLNDWATKLTQNAPLKDLVDEAEKKGLLTSYTYKGEERKDFVIATHKPLFRIVAGKVTFFDVSKDYEHPILGIDLLTDKQYSYEVKEVDISQFGDAKPLRVITLDENNQRTDARLYLEGKEVGRYYFVPEKIGQQSYAGTVVIDRGETTNILSQDIRKNRNYTGKEPLREIYYFDDTLNLTTHLKGYNVSLGKRSLIIPDEETKVFEFIQEIDKEGNITREFGILAQGGIVEIKSEGTFLQVLSSSGEGSAYIVEKTNEDFKAIDKFSQSNKPETENSELKSKWESHIKNAIDNLKNKGLFKSYEPQDLTWAEIKIYNLENKLVSSTYQAFHSSFGERPLIKIDPKKNRIALAITKDNIILGGAEFSVNNNNDVDLVSVSIDLPKEGNFSRTLVYELKRKVAYIELKDKEGVLVKKQEGVYNGQVIGDFKNLVDNNLTSQEIADGFVPESEEKITYQDFTPYPKVFLRLLGIGTKGETVVFTKEVELSSLPQGVSFESLEEPLKNKINYNQKAKKIIFKGEMTENEKNKLLDLSQDNNYQTAINNLFNQQTKSKSSLTKLEFTNEGIKLTYQRDDYGRDSDGNNYGIKKTSFETRLNGRLTEIGFGNDLNSLNSKEIILYNGQYGRFDIPDQTVRINKAQDNKWYVHTISNNTYLDDATGELTFIKKWISPKQVEYSSNSNLDNIFDNKAYNLQVIIRSPKGKDLITLDSYFELKPKIEPANDDYGNPLWVTFIPEYDAFDFAKASYTYPYKGTINPDFYRTKGRYFGLGRLFGKTYLANWENSDWLAKYSYLQFTDDGIVYDIQDIRKGRELQRKIVLTPDGRILRLINANVKIRVARGIFGFAIKGFETVYYDEFERPLYAQDNEGRTTQDWQDNNNQPRIKYDTSKGCLQEEHTITQANPLGPDIKHEYKLTLNSGKFKDEKRIDISTNYKESILQNKILVLSPILGFIILISIGWLLSLWRWIKVKSLIKNGSKNSASTSSNRIILPDDNNIPNPTYNAYGFDEQTVRSAKDKFSVVIERLRRGDLLDDIIKEYFESYLVWRKEVLKLTDEFQPTIEDLWLFFLLQQGSIYFHSDTPSFFNYLLHKAIQFRDKEEGQKRGGFVRKEVERWYTILHFTLTNFKGIGTFGDTSQLVPYQYIFNIDDLEELFRTKEFVDFYDGLPEGTKE
ncbi:MAG: hypothetical protein NC904_08200, partial [Candidatus Omnitrophica bacterium]|nr:hypothetical protein [Candidatus Omnitrophota bacterium]